MKMLHPTTVHYTWRYHQTTSFFLVLGGEGSSKHQHAHQLTPTRRRQMPPQHQVQHLKNTRNILAPSTRRPRPHPLPLHLIVHLIDLLTSTLPFTDPTLNTLGLPLLRTKGVSQLNRSHQKSLMDKSL